MTTAAWVLGGFILLVLYFRFSNWLMWGRKLNQLENPRETIKSAVISESIDQQHKGFGASGFQPGPVSWTQPAMDRGPIRKKKGRK